MPLSGPLLMFSLGMTPPPYVLFCGGPGTPMLAYQPIPGSPDNLIAAITPGNLNGTSAHAYDPNAKRLYITRNFEDITPAGVRVFNHLGNSLSQVGPDYYDPQTNVIGSASTSNYFIPAFSPDGSWLQTATAAPLNFSQWNGSYYPKGANVNSIYPYSSPYQGVFTSDNQYCYVGGAFSFNAATSVWRNMVVAKNSGGVWSTTQELNGTGAGAAVYRLDLSVDQTYVVVVGEGGEVRRLTRSGDTLVSSTSIGAQASGGQGRCVKFHPNGQNLFVLKSGGEILQTWAISGATYTKITSPTIAQSGHWLSISPDGTILAIALNSSPFLRLFRLSGAGAGLSFTEMPAPSPLPSSLLRWVQFALP